MRYLLPIVLFLLSYACSGSKFTGDETQLAKFRALNVCRGCDLTGANLRGSNFLGADLSGTDLSRANLNGADLRKAKELRGGRFGG